MRSRVAFHESVTPQSFTAFCQSQGWRYLGGSSPADTGEPSEHVWLAEDSVEVHWLSDNVIHRIYAVLLGEETFRVETRIRIAFESYGIEEAARKFTSATTWEERVLALSLVAATAPENFYQPTFDSIMAGLNDAHPVVRHQAVLAVFYASWPEYVPELRYRSTHDEDEKVRETAAIALDTIAEGGR